jgi:hypothetical protein
LAPAPLMHSCSCTLGNAFLRCRATRSYRMVRMVFVARRFVESVLNSSRAGEGPARRYSEEVYSGKDRRMADTQLADLQNMRVLLQEARGLARDLAYHRRARLEAVLGRALEEVDRQIEDLRTDEQ